MKKNKILIFDGMDNYYLKKQRSVLDYNINNLKTLKNHEKLPYVIKFYDCPRTVIAKTIHDLIDDNISFQLTQIDDKNYEVCFYEARNEIIAYKLSDEYQLIKDVNPYMAINENNKILLLEVTKDYAKKYDGEYYYLRKDLTLEEKNKLGKYFVRLKYDYLYELNNYKCEYNNFCEVQKLIKSKKLR